MIVAVTGGTGFIGRHVVAQLLSAGHDAVAVDLAPSPDAARFVGADITDRAALTAAFVNVDRVIHLAALADFSDVDRNPDLARAVNGQGTLTVLQAAHDAGVARVVYGSTFWVYDGLDTDTADETTPLLPPRHLYTETKLDGELHCADFANELEVVICRIGTAYGPGARPALMTSRMLSLASTNQPLTINGDGSQGRQLTYVGDVADGLVRAASRGRPGATYNLVGPRIVSVREVADEVAAIVGDGSIVYTPARRNDVRMPLVSSQRAVTDLGWAPATPVRDGLARQLVRQLVEPSAGAGRSQVAAVGFIDQPASGNFTFPLSISGWALGITHAVSSIDVQLGGRAPRRAALHRVRSGLSATGLPGAELGAFAVMFERRDPTDGARVPVEVTATLLDGSTTRFTASIEVADHIGPTPAPPTVRTNRWGRLPRRRPKPTRLLVWARALGGGGSQLRMCELTEALAADGTFVTTIASPLEGPLRPRLEAAGAEVSVVPRIRFGSETTYRDQVNDAVEWARGRFDLVFVPTITSFPGLEIVARLGLPSVWRIGEVESLETVAGWLGDRVHPRVAIRAAQAYRLANRVLFNCRAGLAARRREGFDGRFVTLGTGVDFGAATSVLARSTQADSRRLLDLPETGRLFVSTASIWPVKAQAALVVAVGEVVRAGADVHLAVVGGQTEPYTSAVARLADANGIGDRVRLDPLADDVSPWLRAADVFVLPSESESMPSSALEAMAFGLPVLATAAGGVPEIVIDGETGWLCEPSNVRSLTDALLRAAVAADEEIVLMGKRGSALVAAEHDRIRAIEAMVGLLRTVGAERSTGSISE